MESTNEWKSGGFNEQGMVANFGRQGMELDLASKELIANSIDAGATEINSLKKRISCIFQIMEKEFPSKKIIICFQCIVQIMKEKKN